MAGTIMRNERKRGVSSLRDWAALGGFLAATSAVAAIGSVFTRSGMNGWYEGLRRPAFDPPGAAFGIAWTILYVMIAIAAWLVWLRRDDGDIRRALTLWVIQLALNLGWTAIFFGAKQPGAALIEIVLLWVAVVLTIAAFAPHSRTAAGLMAPYIAWVTFAAALNFEYWRLN